MSIGRYWHGSSFVEPAVLERDGVSFVAIHHRGNRIVVGVEAASQVEPILMVLRELPMPRSAYGVIVAGPIAETASQDTLLQDRFVPVKPGGVKIERLNVLDSTTHTCTLGFNLVKWTSSTVISEDRFFTTNGHCSSNHGAADNSYFGQDWYQEAGGNEVLDPAPFTHSNNPYCPKNRACWLADASVFKYSQPLVAEQGKVVWTGYLGSYVVTGRVTITATGIPFEGQYVHMIGSFTGRQAGQVLHPCSVVKMNPPAPAKAYVCVAIAAYASHAGDSGGPVMAVFGDGTAWAMGLTFAQHNGVSYFGHMDAALGAFYVASGGIYDPRYIESGMVSAGAPSSSVSTPDYATISGTEVSGPDMTCHWYGATNIENPSYEWKVNGVVIGTESDVYYSAATSFVLELHVTDSETGAFAYKESSITVSQGAEQCYDQ